MNDLEALKIINQKIIKQQKQLLEEMMRITQMNMDLKELDEMESFKKSI